MTHHITEEQWVDYLENVSDFPARGAVTLHLKTCPECSRLLADFEDCEAALTYEAAALGRALGLPQERARVLADDALALLHRQASVAASERRRFTVREGVQILQSVFKPIYGPNIVERIFQMAAATCAGSVADGLAPHQWTEFAASLDLTASEILGREAGRAVRSLTAHLPVERAA